MNEVKICPSIPYSVMKRMFISELYLAFSQQAEMRLVEIIETIKANWLLFDSGIRICIIGLFRSETKFEKYHSVEFHKIITEFITWEIKHRGIKPTTARPLNDYISVKSEE